MTLTVDCELVGQLGQATLELGNGWFELCLSRRRTVNEPWHRCSIPERHKFAFTTSATTIEADDHGVGGLLYSTPIQLTLHLPQLSTQILLLILYPITPSYEQRMDPI